MEILKQAPWSRIKRVKQREQRSLGDCWQWKANGQCSKGDNCSFRHDTNKRAKMTQPNPSPESSTQQNVKKCIENQESPEAEAQEAERLDVPARTTSKELAPIHSVKSGTLQNACSTSPRVDAGLKKSALMRIARLTNQPSKRSQKNGDTCAVAILKKGDWQERGPVTDQCHDRPGQPR